MAYRQRASRELAEAAAALDGVVSPALIEDAVLAYLDVMLAAVQRSTRDRLTQDPTGALMRSWEIDLRITSAGKADGAVRSGLPYAAIHDRGGTIRPRRRYLAIPNLDVLGRSRRGLWPRHDRTPMRFVPGRRRGTAYLVELGRGGRVRYTLRESVTLPATRYVEIAVSSSEDTANNALAERLTEALERASQT